jgi:hypothetical protein
VNRYSSSLLEATLLQLAPSPLLVVYTRQDYPPPSPEIQGQIGERALLLGLVVVQLEFLRSAVLKSTEACVGTSTLRIPTFPSLANSPEPEDVDHIC